MKPTVVVTLLSGGLDSTIALRAALMRWPSATHQALTLSYDHPARERELRASRSIANYYDVPWCGREVLLSSYANMDTWWVPQRNLIFVAHGAAWAESFMLERSGEGKGVVVIGLHDGSVTLDASPRFLRDARKAVRSGRLVGRRNQLDVWAPFVKNPQGTAVQWGRRKGIPFDLTYSCFEGGPVHCGDCPACKSRRDSMKDMPPWPTMGLGFLW